MDYEIEPEAFSEEMEDFRCVAEDAVCGNAWEDMYSDADTEWGADYDFNRPDLENCGDW